MQRYSSMSSQVTFIYIALLKTTSAGQSAVYQWQMNQQRNKIHIKGNKVKRNKTIKDKTTN